MIRAIPTAMLPEVNINGWYPTQLTHFLTKILCILFCTIFFSQLSFYKAMADEGGHGFLDPLDYDPLDSDFAPDDEDISKWVDDQLGNLK